MAAKKVKRGNDGKYVWIVDFYWHPDPSKPAKRIRLDSPINTKRGAEEHERKVRQELVAGTFGRQEKKKQEKVKPSVTFEAFAEEFMKTYAKVNNKPSEQAAKEKNFRLYLNPFFGAMVLKKVGTREVEAFKAAMLEEEYKVKTINNMLATLKKLFGTAVDWNELTVSPKVKNLKHGEEAEIKFFSAEQAIAVIGELRDPLLRAMATFGLHTGLRIGELRSLYWNDIKARKVVVRRNLWKSQLGTTKGGRSRELGLNEQAVKALQGVPRHLHSEFVFCNADGTPLRHNHGYKTLKSAARRAGIPFSVGYHTLRHTFASHLVMKGKSLREVQFALGHADISMTMKYAHLSPEVKAQTTLVLDDLFGNIVSA